MELNKTVIIYQMGKVASSTIKHSLSGISGLNVIHAHHLNSMYTKELNGIKKKMGWEITITPDSVDELFSEIDKQGELIIITLVREPIGRNISAYFQNLDAIYGVKNAHKKLTTSKLIENFFKNYPHSIPLTWFDNELKETLGVDIYQYQFPKDEGALIINEGRTRMLVMHFDIDDSKKQKYIEEILGIKGIPIIRENIAKEKPYSKVYKDFLENIRFPDSYLNEMLDSKYARHFFDAGKLEILKGQWGQTK